MGTTTDRRCYRHPDRRAGVKCTRCGQLICPECMVPAPVGHHCPDCVAADRRARGRHREVAPFRRGWARIPVTKALVLVNVAVFAVTGLGAGRGLLGVERGDALSDGLLSDGLLWGPAVADGEWWRLVTGGFLHGGVMHVGFNMLALWVVGGMLEQVAGPVRMGVAYLASLLGGSLGVMLLDPDAPTVGASGAVFGLFGFAFVATAIRSGRRFAWQQYGGLLVVNAVISFAPGISLGGHLGGFVTGAAVGWILVRVPAATGRRWVADAAVAAIAVALAVAGVLAAEQFATPLAEVGFLPR